MASHHSAVPISDADSAAADSLASTPRSDLHDDPAAYALQPRVRFMCSFGGKILPRPTDNQLRYVGGDTRMVAVNRHATSYAALLSKLAKLAGTTNISIKYQLPSEDLDALITVTGDEDVENMMEEYDRLGAGAGGKPARLRLFLFPGDAAGADDSRATSINSLLDGSAKRQNWFFDALNGPVLERGRSEVSSIVSEVPDYLFGLDNSDDPIRDPLKMKNRNLVNDNVSQSDPGSPAPISSSQFCSTASSLPPVVPDLPPVKTKPVSVTDAQSGYSGSPMWQYTNPAAQPVPTAVYYAHHPAPNTSVQPAPIRAQFMQPYPVGPVQLPIGFPGVNQLYAPPGGRPYDMPMRLLADNMNPPAVYYGAPNVAIIPGSGMEEMQGPGPDVVPGRVVRGS